MSVERWRAARADWENNGCVGVFREKKCGQRVLTSPTPLRSSPDRRPVNDAAQPLRYLFNHLTWRCGSAVTREVIMSMGNRDWVGEVRIC